MIPHRQRLHFHLPLSFFRSYAVIRRSTKISNTLRARRMAVASHDASGAHCPRKVVNLPIAPARRISNKMFVPLAATGICLAEALAIFASGLLSFVSYASNLPGTRLEVYLALILLASCLFPFFTAVIHALELRSLAENSLRLHRLLAAWAITLLVVVGIAFFLRIAHETSRGWVSMWLCSAAIFLVALRLLAFRAARRWRAEGRFEKAILVVGAGEHGQHLIHSLRNIGDPVLRVVGYFDDRADRVPDQVDGIFYLGTISDLLMFVRDNSVDDILIALPWSAEERIFEITRQLCHLTSAIHLAPEMICHRLRQPAPDAIYGLPMLRLLRPPISDWGLLAKEIKDRLFAVALLAALAPLMLVIAVLIKLDSQGPVFFRQRRLGFNNKRFYVWKFRTMFHGRKYTGGIKQAAKSDPRVTRFGRLLRRTSLDEIPQLLNVLAGEMSLVGPRPHPIWAQADELWIEAGPRPLQDLVSGYAARHRVKPGITGWAQVCGHRGETQTPDEMKERIELDLFYIDNWSWKFDLRILLMTIPAVLSRRNSY
jgi:polysaccharide biosynthesis protein PslA